MLAEQQTYYAYTGNGVTSEFSFGCRIFSISDLSVRVAGTPKAAGIHFTLSGVNSVSGGSITFLPGNIPVSGDVVELERIMDVARNVSYQEMGKLIAQDLDYDQDIQTALIQQMAAKMVTIPSRGQRKSKLLGFDALGDIALFSPDDTPYVINLGTPVSGFASLNAAVNSLGNNMTLLVSTPCALTADLSIPSYLSVIVVRGGTITTNGYALNIYGQFNAGPYHVFYGGETVRFSGGTADGVRPEWFGARDQGSMDDTAAFNLTFTATPSGGKLLGTPGAMYYIGQTSPIDKPIIIDLNGANIQSVTSGIMFQYGLADPSAHSDHFALRNGNVVQGTSNPSDIIRFNYGGINPVVENINIQQVTATHSYIWNYASYGLQINSCKMREGRVPSAVHISHSDIDPGIFSNCIDLNSVDISNIDGTGVRIEGGIVNIRGGTVIEGCTGKGILHVPVAYINQLSVRDAYFEQNYAADIDISAATGGNHVIASCFFGDGSIPTSSYNHILVGEATNVCAMGNTFTNGGVNGTPPASYVGVNNIVRVHGAPGFSSTNHDAELADAIRGGTKKTIINPGLATKLVNVAAGSNSPLISAQPLTGTAFDEWQIAGSYNFATRIDEIIRVFVNRQDGAISGLVIADKQEPELLTLDVAPGTTWSVGDTITGATSTTTCEITRVITNRTYLVKNRNGEFSLGEVLSNGLSAADQGAASPTCSPQSGVSHSIVTVQDLGGSYNINVRNSGTITMHYSVRHIRNNRIF